MVGARGERRPHRLRLCGAPARELRASAPGPGPPLCARDGRGAGRPRCMAQPHPPRTAAHSGGGGRPRAGSERRSRGPRPGRVPLRRRRLRPDRARAARKSVLPGRNHDEHGDVSALPHHHPHGSGRTRRAGGPGAGGARPRRGGTAGVRGGRTHRRDPVRALPPRRDGPVGDLRAPLRLLQQPVLYRDDRGHAEWVARGGARHHRAPEGVRTRTRRGGAGQEQVVQRVPRPGAHARRGDGRADRPRHRRGAGRAHLPRLPRDRPHPRQHRQRQLQHRGRAGGSLPVRRRGSRHARRLPARRGAQGQALRPHGAAAQAGAFDVGVLRHLPQGEPHRARE